jgi:predicted ester cyclase
VDSTFRAPGLAAEIKVVVAEGDLVATLKTFTGPHEAELNGHSGDR